MKMSRGFTLPEIMISLTIIGIIMIFYIPVHKTVSVQYTTLAYSAYEALNLLSKELLSGGATEQGAASPIIYRNRSFILTPDTPALCKSAANTMNVVKARTYCPGDEKDYLKIFISPHILEFRLEDFNWSKPNIVGTNGFRYYISKHHSIQKDVSKEYGFRVIAVDLTGKKGPNIEDKYPPSATDKKRKPADIIFFLMLDNGRVLPLGNAATDTRYLNTRIIAYYYSKENVPRDIVDSTATGCKVDPDRIGEDINANKEVTPGDCRFWKENLKDPENPDEIAYPFRTSYCMQNGKKGDFVGYSCPHSLQQHKLCKIGGKADECRLDVIKPLYKIKI